jgi:hypothetical protein
MSLITGKNTHNITSQGIIVKKKSTKPTKEF